MTSLSLVFLVSSQRLLSALRSFLSLAHWNWLKTLSRSKPSFSSRDEFTVTGFLLKGRRDFCQHFVCFFCLLIEVSNILSWKCFQLISISKRKKRPKCWQISLRANKKKPVIVKSSLELNDGFDIESVCSEQTDFIRFRFPLIPIFVLLMHLRDTR